MSGKTIDLHLMNGTAESIVRAKLSNWNGIAYRIPKVEVSRCKLNDLCKPGVYFLFGKDEEGRLTCYVGQSDNTLRRLKQHLTDADDWTMAVAFLGGDLDATKILFLEDECFHRIRQYNRCEMRTQVTNANHFINDEDKDIALQYLENMKIILPVLGYYVLDPVTGSSEIKKKDTLHLDVNDIHAEGAETAEGFTVFARSLLTLNPSDSLPDNVKRKREILFQDGIVKGNEFMANSVFNSSSEAAAVILGYAVSGPQTWHYEDGTSLKQANEKAAREAE